MLSAANTYPAATAVHFVLSVHAIHPATVHCLHYFTVASKYHPALQAVQAAFAASQVPHPFVPSRHL